MEGFIMSDSTPLPSSPTVDPSPQDIFHQQWRIYRTMVDNNYLFHTEASATLRQILMDEATRPFRFLDLACGDGAEIVEVLQGTPIARYHGVDLSRAALDLAESSLARLSCPVQLEQRDFVEAVTVRPQPANVVWIGQSLHHFQMDDKLHIMRAIRQVVGDRGLLIVYEPTCPDHEGRDDWMRRWDEQRPFWTAYTPSDLETMTAHVHAADYPETPSRWRELGRLAGFATTREVFIAPSDLFRMYRFGP
jgi:ubiquinone/menaquinone biosynthesis C-methylase UbiE